MISERVMIFGHFKLDNCKE